MKKSAVKVLGTPPEETEENILKKLEQERKMAEELAAMLKKQKESVLKQAVIAVIHLTLLVMIFKTLLVVTKLPQ